LPNQRKPLPCPWVALMARRLFRAGSRNLDMDDIEIARIYMGDFFNGRYYNRGNLGRFLQINGMGLNHHTFSNCLSHFEYINLILDYVIGGKAF
jgi:hypothetical protein